ncbi:hypothetical protein E2C01_090752 [Portunus trituberculatus]|uniref:Uncharacterized protein n=1 Tax=Portunus trituberculatus TaxID=210409 RepID=A0A5B7JML1_PORTR|nr:hypothetical protein [Portunus trituberculatus]
MFLSALLFFPSLSLITLRSTKRLKYVLAKITFFRCLLFCFITSSASLYPGQVRRGKERQGKGEKRQRSHPSPKTDAKHCATKDVSKGKRVDHASSFVSPTTHERPT